jgi:hypothetical protein
MNSFSGSIETGDAAFQPCQIVCIELRDTRLYAEVVQTVEQTQVCWVRPLVLMKDCSSLERGNAEFVTQRVYDLRQGSDVMLPAVLFRVALDIEVIPLITDLHSIDPAIAAGTTFSTVESSSAQHQQLNEFVRKVCVEHPEAF